jgi:hypothetical protein
MSNSRPARPLEELADEALELPGTDNDRAAGCCPHPQLVLLAQMSSARCIAWTTWCRSCERIETTSAWPGVSFWVGAMARHSRCLERAVSDWAMEPLGHA